MALHLCSQDFTYCRTNERDQMVIILITIYYNFPIVFILEKPDPG